MKKIIYLFIAGIVMSSCDYVYDYSYEVSNNTDAPIQIKVKTFHIDSTIVIEENHIQVLFVTDHGVEGPNGPHFSDVKDDLESFSVSSGDTLFSNRNFLENEEWTFNDGVYYTIITETEFE